MCDCINEIQERAKVGLSTNNPDLEINYVMVNATSSTPQKVGVKAFYSAEKKLKNGKTKHVEDSVNLIATHCPFCGEKYQN
jgi:hypothetical protein